MGEVHQINLDPEKYVEIANEINSFCRDYRKRNASRPESEVVEEMRSAIFDKYASFARSHPIVLRYMIDLKEYRRAAFEKFVKWVALKRPGITEDLNRIADQNERYDAAQMAELRVQAEYVVFLYKETHNHYNNTAVNSLRNNITHMLLNEYCEIKQQIESSNNNVAEVKKKFAEMNARDLATKLQQTGPIDPNRVDVFVDSGILEHRGHIAASTTTTTNTTTNTLPEGHTSSDMFL